MMYVLLILLIWMGIGTLTLFHSRSKDNITYYDTKQALNTFYLWPVYWASLMFSILFPHDFEEFIDDK